MKFYLLLLITVFFEDILCKKHGHHRSRHPKIVGGYDITIEDAPYQAYLLLEQDEDDYYQCGGSIISDTYILTAAHCLEGIEKAFVRVGSTDADSGGTEYTSAELTIHPEYNTNGDYDKDVAVIRLSKPIDIDGITTQVIDIADDDYNVEPGTNIRISGWGDTSEDGDISETLMAVEVPTVSNEECNDTLGGITSNIFCAGYPEGGKDSCQGDSGGPAVSTDSNTQIGIVSFGVGCARPGYPGVYTNIASVRVWIRTTTGV